MRNKKVISKILSLILVLALTTNIFTIIGKAFYNNSQITDDTFKKLNDYISSVLPGYLKFNNLHGLEVTVSEPMTIHNWNVSMY